MTNRIGISRKALIFVFVVLILLVSRVVTPVPVSAAIPADGRINLIPWVNSWGAVAAYCVDHNGGSASFTGGGIKLLSGSGQQLFFAPESLITPARTQADHVGHSVLILTQGLYSLFALPNGFFQINSAPDAEGKTFIGRWQDCTPVGPGPDNSSPSRPACVPFPKPPPCKASTCRLSNGGDANCDGVVDFNDILYCDGGFCS